MRFSRFVRPKLKSIRNFLRSVAVVVALGSLVGCQFEPDIDPLILPDAPPQGFQSVPEEGGEIVEPEPITAGGGVIGLAGFDSTQAMAQCGEQLTWGNEDIGICDAPGSDTFYVWISRDEVLEVEAGSPYLLNFQLAAESRTAAADGFKQDGVSVGVGVAGFILELVLLAPACATVILCALDTTALTFTGVSIANSADSGVKNYQSFIDSTQNAGFYYCIIQGSPEGQCRDTYIQGDSP